MHSEQWRALPTCLCQRSFVFYGLRNINTVCFSLCVVSSIGRTHSIGTLESNLVYTFNCACNRKMLF
jgi:hypothetical protein